MSNFRAGTRSFLYRLSWKNGRTQGSPDIRPDVHPKNVCRGESRIRPCFGFNTFSQFPDSLCKEDFKEIPDPTQGVIVLSVQIEPVILSRQFEFIVDFNIWIWYSIPMDTIKDKAFDFNQAGDSPLEQFFAKNITELKRLLDAVSIGIIFLDKAKRSVFFANKYFYSTSEKIRGKFLSAIFDFLDKNINKPTHLNRHQEVIVAGNEEELKFSFTVHRITRDITGIFFTEVTSRTIYFESKQKNQFYDGLSELVGEIAHEIGNPLSGISVSLQLLTQHLPEWPLEKIKSHIERNVTEINRLADFLKRIREVSSRDRVAITETNLKAIIDKVILQVEPHLKMKKISWRNRVDGNITVLVDEAAFHRILLNLFNNSLRILSAGNKIKICVEAISNIYVTLVYQNDGEPIPEELMEKIFSPFFTTSDTGEGLGLAISQKLMTRMGGSIKAVPPKDGIGAKFLLHIPYD